MKVIESIESIYNEQKILYEKLEIKVKATIDAFKQSSWFYLGRIKSIESYALKLETGRFGDAKSINDFFACTLVVENLSQINHVVRLIKKEFVIVVQKPKDLLFTHKLSHSFEFDDLRLYVKLKKTPYIDTDPISELEFEIQIKTFLQHAWGIATHDLIYKTDMISWPKERIAYQIKAMLEQAEVAISSVNEMINVPEINKENSISKKQKKILNFFSIHYEKEDLPKDLVRLCKNTLELLVALNLDITELEKILIKETALGRGTKLKNLSPYLLIMQSILNQKPELFDEYINSTDERKFKLIIPKEVNIGSLVVKNENNIVKL
jgi:ppGpp synthetase/RelA/SpoT-type nucleotidyltranferase